MVIRCIAALSLLLAGMALMTASLRRGGGAERLFSRMRSGRAAAFLCGMLGTAAMQSSSASTVLIAGAYDAGLLPFSAMAAAIAGANVGTTATGWLLCFGLRVGRWTAAVLAAAVACALAMKKPGAAGTAAGLLLIELGLGALSGSTAAGAARLLGSSMAGTFFRAAALTGVIQSSSAAIAFLQAASKAGALPLGTALAAVLGSNVGTCTTALLASVGGGRGAKRAALTHLGFNALASALGFSLYALFSPHLARTASPARVAALHTLVNVLPSVPVLLNFKFHVAHRRDLYYDEKAK